MFLKCNTCYAIGMFYVSFVVYMLNKYAIIIILLVIGGRVCLCYDPFQAMLSFYNDQQLTLNLFE